MAQLIFSLSILEEVDREAPDRVMRYNKDPYGTQTLKLSNRGSPLWVRKKSPMALIPP